MNSTVANETQFNFVETTLQELLQLPTSGNIITIHLKENDIALTSLLVRTATQLVGIHNVKARPFQDHVTDLDVITLKHDARIDNTNIVVILTGNSPVQLLNHRLHSTVLLTNDPTNVNFIKFVGEHVPVNGLVAVKDRESDYYSVRYIPLKVEA